MDEQTYQSIVAKRYKLNDKILVDRLRTEYQEAVVNAKENYLKNLGSKLGSKVLS